MDQTKAINLSNELRQKVHDCIKNFWLNRDTENNQEFFLINSMFISALIAQIVDATFDKKHGIKPRIDYIDNICSSIKEIIKLQKVFTKKGTVQ
jgi:hypothetical protein